MRVLGWVMFAATCILFALQGLFLAASTFPMTSYEVLVDQVFPLLGIGAMVGAGVGALIVEERTSRHRSGHEVLGGAHRQATPPRQFPTVPIMGRWRIRR